MKKTIILSIFLLLIYSVSAFSFSEFFTDNLKELVTGSSIEKEA